jgi:predicted DNA-binding transcriptional regulator AlpA
LADSLSTVEANQQMTSDNLIKLTEVVTKLADSVSTVEANQQMTSDNLIKLTEVVTKLADSVSTVEANQQMTSDNLIKLTEVVMKLADSLSGVDIKAVILEAQAESDRAEIREAVGKLISSEEETRRFAIEIAQLVKQHETRISQLENK